MKIAIEIDDNGLKANMSFEFDKKCMDVAALREMLADKIVDILNISGVISESARPVAEEQPKTLMDSLAEFIKYEFRDQWFTSQQLRERYETVRDDIKLSTVSTYLSRMHQDGILDRRGNRNNREYRLLSTASVEGAAYSRKKQSASKL
ncbi:MAG: hypothetical protein QHG98_08065 [Methanothrix sp.]|uniref:hypothetical protein n=1 Tax=Methanothrix sp. TaxID=90426 RepID=UPI00247E3580|nr:hypothetical protein [Methanothrix sp.]